ncbi:MAG: DUF2844 domain-containing protein [Polyangiaceae bacterium]
MSDILPCLGNAPGIGRGLAAAAVVVACSLTSPRDARATLGGDVASVAANEQHLSAARQVHKLALGERHELALPSGLVVREYVSPAGAVYAVTWTGPRMPDLRELLGPYFAQLAGHDAAVGHHRMSVTGTDLVVRSSGHRHHFAGRAWVPSLVPAGVDAGSLE